MRTLIILIRDVFMNQQSSDDKEPHRNSSPFEGERGNGNGLKKTDAESNGVNGNASAVGVNGGGVVVVANGGGGGGVGVVVNGISVDDDKSFK